MKSFVVCSLIGLVLLVAAGQVRAECDDTKSPEDSDIGHFFKNLGCKFNQGAKEVVEATKPYAEKIGEGAKEFGSSVAHKYDELKHKLTEELSTTPKVPVAYDAPTEKVLLAPIGGPSTPAP
ncbi:uncharacterized protein LOC108103174 [Drosophila eugracilis]|uniref:uncharacterized protein LOC108103174 n=1 Tax=Drosophila eugracilis TaxID=29029 RepID=UPI0007E81A9C|nr:uncharacterized protein LOC108103174 [Drosophila eugracilis]